MKDAASFLGFQKYFYFFKDCYWNPSGGVK